jgi:hypothetical protein
MPSPTSLCSCDSQSRLGTSIDEPALIRRLLRRLFPDQVLTTEQVGRAMLAVARVGAPKPILESQDIRALAVAR